MASNVLKPSRIALQHVRKLTAVHTLGIRRPWKCSFDQRSRFLTIDFMHNRIRIEDGHTP